MSEIGVSCPMIAGGARAAGAEGHGICFINVMMALDVYLLKRNGSFGC
jgi:hypothetical protein